MELTKELLKEILIDYISCAYCKNAVGCFWGEKSCFELDESSLPEIMKELEEKK